MKVVKTTKVLALLATIAFGAYLRFSDLDWDGNFQFHPDERGILFLAQSIALPRSDAILTRESTLNPLTESDGQRSNYAYGHFHLYTIVAAERLMQKVCPTMAQLCTDVPAGGSDAAYLSRLTLAARLLSSLADTITIILVALLTHRLFSDFVATWMASAATAVAVIHIQNAHFGTVDSLLTMFCTVTIVGLVRYVQTSDVRFNVLAAVGIAFAIGAKSTGLILLVPFAVAHLTFSKVDGRRRFATREHSSPRVLFSTLVAVAVIFIITNPYAVVFPVEFLRNLTTQAQMASGLLDWPFTRQYIRTPPILYHLIQQSRWELGLPLAAAIYCGLIWAIRRATREQILPLHLALSWPLTVLVLIGTQFAKFPRYLLPALPIMFVLAGGMIASITWCDKSRTQILRLALGCLFILTSTVYALSFHAMFTAAHPWLAASEWVYRSIPAGSVIAGEYWDDRLPVNMVLDGEEYVRDEVYEPVTLDPFSEPDNEQKVRRLTNSLARSDYLVLASNRLYGTIPRLDDRYPLTATYYRLLFASELGFTSTQSFSRYPQLGSVSLVDDPFTRAGLSMPTSAPTGVNLGFADESFTVYDHPLVLIFENTERLSSHELFERITLEANDPQIRR